MGLGPDGTWARWRETDNVRSRVKVQEQTEYADGFSAGECEDRKQEVEDGSGF